MTERTIDELGPVDYLIVEFPAGHQNFTGEGAEELLKLHDAGIIRVMDILILQKGTDGTVMAQELGDVGALGDLVRAACQTPSASSIASSASTAAMMAWIGIRPLAMSWPPARRMAEANGAAHRFS